MKGSDVPLPGHASVVMWLVCQVHPNGRLPSRPGLLCWILARTVPLHGHLHSNQAWPYVQFSAVWTPLGQHATCIVSSISHILCSPSIINSPLTLQVAEGGARATRFIRPVWLWLQAEAAQSVCITALSASTVPLTLGAAALAWHRGLTSVHKAYDQPLSVGATTITPACPAAA